MDENFIGKTALTLIKEKGVKQKLIGLEIEGDPFIGSNDFFWPLFINKIKVGTVTSAIYNPRLKKNIALAMVNLELTKNSTELIVDKLGETRKGVVVPIPFYKKNQKRIIKND